MIAKMPHIVSCANPFRTVYLCQTLDYNVQMLHLVFVLIHVLNTKCVFIEGLSDQVARKDVLITRSMIFIPEID